MLQSAAMDFAYHYGDPSRLYLNVTNRCTNRCGFCVRNGLSGLGDGRLWGGAEPDLDALLSAISDRWTEEVREVVWCGFGEPTFRLDLIVAAAPWLRARGLRIRVNTNGHAGLIHGRDPLPELAAAVDVLSVSLNAPDAARYLELCRPDPSSLGRSVPPEPAAFWEAMIDFLGRAVGKGPGVYASVVGAALSEEEIEACRDLARRLGAHGFRVR